MYFKRVSSLLLSSKLFSFTKIVALFEPAPPSKPYPVKIVLCAIAGLVANIASTCLTIFLVSSRPVPGGVCMLINKLPVSSLGTKLLFVFIAVTPKTTIPITKEITARAGFLTNTVTIFLYLSRTLSYDALKEAWNRSILVIFLSVPSSL